jgi:beta-glucosidase-like glycosyl hydrolase
VADLRNRLSLEEKVYMTQPQEKFGNMCGTTTGEMDRLGIPQYTWLIETNTNVASSCMEDGRCATTFVGPEGMGASFNKTSWFMKGSVFGNEMRAYNNINWHRSTNSDHDPPYDYIGVTGFGPNINLARDPRFGRNSELPGEDPLLSGTYGSQMTQGMQEEDANGHPKMISYLKHLTAYSTETNRGHDNYIISDHDLWESYLPAFEKAFVEGGSSGAMCSYNAINGAPSCANEYILTDVVRGMWSPDAHVTSDCGAISNLMGDPVNAPSAEAAASMAMNAGTGTFNPNTQTPHNTSPKPNSLFRCPLPCLLAFADIDMGSATMTDHLANATNIGMVDEATLDASFDRSMKVLFRAGRFDPVDSIEWSTFGKETVNSTEHQQISYEAALQSMVLLRNDDNVLPLKSGVSVAVVGPMANDPSRYLSSYAADEICFGGDHHCMTSLADAIAVNNGADKTASADGCDVDSDDESGFDEALDIAKDADVVVLALGIDNSVEYEGVDRTDTSLPGVQSKFGQAVLALGKPVILTLFNGGALAIDELMEGPSAIIEGFNPAVLGPKALSDQMFGLENRWGKVRGSPPIVPLKLLPLSPVSSTRSCPSQCTRTTSSRRWSSPTTSSRRTTTAWAARTGTTSRSRSSSSATDCR